MTEQTSNDSRFLFAMAIAHEVCGQLIAQIPASIRFTSWEIMEGYVGGQYDMFKSDSGPRSGLKSLAPLLELAYGERQQGKLTHIEASGVLNGVKVLLWAHLPAPVERHAASAS